MYNHNLITNPIAIGRKKTNRKESKQETFLAKDS